VDDRAEYKAGAGRSETESESFVYFRSTISSLLKGMFMGEKFIYRPKGSRFWITTPLGFLVFWIFRGIGWLFGRK
jgi:hypothetical protein